MSEQLLQNNRQEGATQLLSDFELTQDAEFFSDPVNRLNFIDSLEFEEFVGITRHVNDRVRGFEPRDKITANEKGGFLPFFLTPSQAEKPEAFRAGFEAIKSYIKESPETADEKVQSVGMAVEALIVWVHPFSDGNGRTSRFLGKFIEDGTTDTDQLIVETSNREARLRMYGEYSRVDNVTDADNEDVLLDDAERENIRRAQADLPIVKGIELSVKRLLEDKSMQQKVLDNTQRYQEKRNQSLARKRLAA